MPSPNEEIPETEELQRLLPPGVQDVMQFPPPELDAKGAGEFVWTSLYDPHYTLLPALIDMIEVTDKLGVRAVVQFAAARGQLYSLVNHALYMETTHAADVTVVSRESSIHTAVLTEAMRSMTAEWTKHMLPSYRAFLKTPNTTTRTAVILALCDTTAVPAELRTVWQLARQHFGNKWGPEYESAGVISVTLLRFICTALVHPLEYGLVDRLQSLEVMSKANELSSIVQAFASGKKFSKYAAQYATAKELAPLRKKIAKFVRSCATGSAKAFESGSAEYNSAAVIPLLRWWCAQQPSHDFHVKWGRKMRMITDWRDSHKQWEQGSDGAAWMQWSGLRAMLDPALLEALQKTLERQRSGLRRGLSAKLKPGSAVNPEVKTAINVAESVQTLQDTHEFIVVVFYRGFWCFFCEKWMKQWAKQLERVRGFGGCIVGITSQDQATAEDTRQKWGIPFPLYGDPENTMARRVFNDIESERANETAVYPKGMGQPSVFAYTKTGVLLHSWTQRAHPRNNQGASDREKPAVSAKVACTVFAQTKNLIPRDESLDSSDWSSIQSSEQSESDGMTDFESTLAECDDEEACAVLAQKLVDSPKFAVMLYNTTGRKTMAAIRRASRESRPKH